MFTWPGSAIMALGPSYVYGESDTTNPYVSGRVTGSGAVLRTLVTRREQRLMSGAFHDGNHALRGDGQG